MIYVEKMIKIDKNSNSTPGFLALHTSREMFLNFFYQILLIFMYEELCKLFMTCKHHNAC